MDELLKKLNTYWHEKSDPKYPGEHPMCAELLDKISEEFMQMSEEELKELLDSMDDDHLEQVTGALMDLPYEWVVEYEKL